MKITTQSAILAGLAGSVLAGLTYRSFRRAMQSAERRIGDGNRFATTRRGPIEYAEAGAGFPTLVIHGAGGGFDQAREMEVLASEGFRLVFVSRFGYLGTPLPADASNQAQADAHAALLEALGIERAAVIGISAGGPSALEFCVRHPERCAGLILLVPAVLVPHARGEALRTPTWMGVLRDTLLRSDLAFWLATKAVHGMMVRHVLGTPPEVLERASPAEQRRAETVLRNILPVSRRRAGLLNDADVVAGSERSDAARVQAPALLISTEDDQYGTCQGARYLAGRIPGARLVVFRKGGHLWVGHQEEVRHEVTEFLGRLMARGTAAEEMRQRR